MMIIHSNIKDDLDDEMRPEYDFDQMEMKPNRFAARFQNNEKDIHLVALDADVAADYPTAEQVNTALRRLIQIRELAQIPLPQIVGEPTAVAG